MSAPKAGPTPGPWELVADRSHYDTLSTVRTSSFVEKWPHRQLLVQVGGAAAPEEQEANARLIAASPDLLEAAKEAIEAIADGDAQSAVNALRAAIAKARGEA